MKISLLLTVLTMFFLLNLPAFSDSKYKTYKDKQRQSDYTNYANANTGKPNKRRLLPFDPNVGEKIAEEIREDIIERRDERREYGF